MKRGYTVIELLVLIIVLGVITAITIGTTSYAFADHSEEYYKVKIANIESNAKRYAMSIEQLKTDKTMIITVKDLVKKGYISKDNSEGDIIDPRNSKATLNNMKIKISYDEEKGYDAVIIEEE